MNKVILLFAATTTIFFIACKPAAEDREKMHANADRIADSIGKVIDTALEEVKIQPSAAADTTKK